MRALTLGVVILLLLVVILWHHESDHINYWLNCKFKNGVNMSGVPTPKTIRMRVNQLVDGLPAPAAGPSDPWYTFVDFGCGAGDIVATVKSSDSLDSVLGVELDAEQAARTRARFAGEPNVQIITQNMTDFEFPDVPLVLYLYEPLWCLPAEEALPIYRRVLENLTESVKKGLRHVDVYIIYVSGVRPMLNVEFFTGYGAQLVHESRARRGLGWAGNKIWMFQL